jgi:SAM-dependent methyltransferase
MDLKQVLNTTSVLLVDNTYAGLKDTTFSKYLLAEMLDSPLDATTAFICDGRIRGVAFKQDFWTLVTDIVRFDPEFESYAAALLQGAKCNKKQSCTVEAADFHRAIVTLLCDLLVSGESCDCHGGRRSHILAYSSERQERLQLLFKTEIELLFDLGAAEMLEICCGNGMATTALYDLGYNVYALDNDKCAICEGLFHGALRKEKTAVLDARHLSEYEFAQYHEFRSVVGFMLGAIYEFNKTDWQKILSEAAAVVNEGLFLLTVHKKEEIDFIDKTMKGFGLKGQVVDNRDDTSIYDQWVYIGVKESTAPGARLAKS